MEFGKRHDTADTTGFCWRQLVADWLGTCRLCWGLFVAVLLYVETGVMDFGLNTRCLLADAYTITPTQSWPLYFVWGTGMSITMYGRSRSPMCFSTAWVGAHGMRITGHACICIYKRNQFDRLGPTLGKWSRREWLCNDQQHYKCCSG